MEQQSHSEVIQASLETCFDAIVDFERYPDWFSGISTATVLESDPEAGKWTVCYTLNIVIKTISYTLAYTGKRPSELDWCLVEGDVSDVRGSYRFVKVGPGLTKATCNQGIEIGFWIPGPIKRTFEASALADSVAEFKVAAEARA
ncbi:MAG: type II toxin-antitoxin system RatA family toxin [Candidatus Binatia bacterium]